MPEYGMAYSGPPIPPPNPNGVPWAPRPSPQELINTPDPSDTISRLLQVRPPMTTPVKPSQPPVWPTPDDVAFARKYDMTYGRPAAGIDTEGQRMGVLPTMQDVAKTYMTKDWGNTRVPMAQADRDREYAAWLASNRSPLAALGFDTGVMHTTPDQPHDEYLSTGSGNTVAAFYVPRNDKMWYGIRDPETIPHEATHRGIEILRRLGEPSVPAYGRGNEAEELMVRALMQRHYGGLEETKWTSPQIRAGKVINQYYPRPIIEAEQAAQREIARRHPMGPN